MRRGWPGGTLPPRISDLPPSPGPVASPKAARCRPVPPRLGGSGGRAVVTGAHDSHNPPRSGAMEARAGGWNSTAPLLASSTLPRSFSDGGNFFSPTRRSPMAALLAEAPTFRHRRRVDPAKRAPVDADDYAPRGARRQRSVTAPNASSRSTREGRCSARALDAGRTSSRRVGLLLDVRMARFGGGGRRFI